MLLLGGFLAKILKMLSILFEILTCDDMQDDASDMLRFLLKYQEMVKIGWFFYSFASLLTPDELRPKILTMEDVIKIYICGKFHQYGICGCEVKNFQSFSYYFSIHEMAPFWWFWALLPQKMHCSIENYIFYRFVSALKLVFFSDLCGFKYAYLFL